MYCLFPNISIAYGGWDSMDIPLIIDYNTRRMSNVAIILMTDLISMLVFPDSPFLLYVRYKGLHENSCNHHLSLVS